MLYSPLLTVLDIDIVYSNTGVIFAGAWISEALHVPHIWHIREFLDEDHGIKPLMGWNNYYKHINKRATIVVMISEALKKKHMKGISGDKITILALVSLLLTAKRAHVLFGIGAMLVVYYMKNADHKSTRLFKMLAIIILALVLFVIIGQFIPAINGFIERFLEAEESGDILNNRSTLYTFAILLFSQNPLLGSGWGSYKYLRESVFGEYNNAHNVFLQLLAETGVIGTVIFISIIVTMLIVTVKTFHKMCVNRECYSKAMYRSCAFAVYMQVFFFLYCFTGNPLYDQIIWIPTVLSAVASFYIGRSQSIVRK